MSTLQGRSLAETYKDLLQVSNSNIGVDGTIRYVEDGEGTASALSISTSKVGVGINVWSTNEVFNVQGDSLITGNLNVTGNILSNNGTVITTNNELAALGNVSIAQPTDGQILKYSGTTNQWTPSDDIVTSYWSPAGINDIYRFTGNVGIGTTNPLKPLHIASDGHHIVIEDTNSSQETKYRGIYNNNQDLHMGRYDNTLGSFTSDVVINEIGRVGIGTGAPDNMLHVSGTGHTKVLTEGGPNNAVGFQMAQNLIDSGDGVTVVPQIWQIQTQAGTNNLQIRNATNTNIPIHMDGVNNRVGINNTSPSHPLTVSGVNDTTFVNSNNTLMLHGTDAWDSGSAGSGISFTGHYSSGVAEQTTFALIYAKKESSTDDGIYDGALIFGTRKNGDGANVDLEKMRITSSGNVGIGTTNPASKLDVQGGYITVKAPSGLANLRLGSDGSNDIYMPTGQNLYIAAADNISFKAGSSLGQLMFIDGSSGNVGISTTNPQSKLTILNTTTSSNDVITLDWEHLTPSSSLEQRIKWRFGDDATSNALSDAGYIAMGKANAWQTAASRSSYISFATTNGLNQVANGGTEPDYTPVERMRISHSGNVGIGTTNPDQRLQVSSTTNVAARFNMIDNGFNNWLTIGCSAGSAATKFTSSTDGFHFDTGATAGANALIIHQDGKVGIGVDYSEIVSKTYRLHVNGTLKIYGTSYVDSSVITSDDRVKHNEQRIVGAIDTLGKILPKKYIKTTDLYHANHNFELDIDGNPIDEYGNHVEHSVEAGVIAQQVLDIPELAFAVIPEDVDEDGNVTNPHSLNYNSLFTYAIAAIQEQQVMIEELKSQNQSLINRIETLENK